MKITLKVITRFNWIKKELFVFELEKQTLANFKLFKIKKFDTYI